MESTQDGRPISLGSWPFLNSLSMRLFVLLFTATAASFAIYAVISVRNTSRYNRLHVNQSAERLSDLIQRSTHYGMLLNRKEDVHNNIRMIAAQPEVEGVRIYDKQGVIIFSADSLDIGTRVDLQAEACVSCHESGEPLVSVPVTSRLRIFESPLGHRVMGLIDPIENAPECSSARCHAHPPDLSVLGVLDVTMSLAETDRRLGVLKGQVIYAAVVMALIAGLFSAGFIFLVVRRPVVELTNGAQQVARGDLETEIMIQSHNEIGQLAGAFNAMTRDLRTARLELTDWSALLEVRLKEKTEELSNSQRQVAHMDKMASLGKLAATVAHELNNPLAGILTYAKLVDRTIQESEAEIPEREEMLRHLSVIEKEAGRSGAIVKNLLIFARPAGAEFALHSFNKILDHTVMLMRHHLEMADISFAAEPIEGDDQLVCDSDQLKQAIVALLVNAVEAMSDGGTLELVAEGLDDAVRLTITDTGVGIPKDELSTIFEPFFSTKEETIGAGLGLAVVYGIIQRHHGDIEIESDLGRGTTVTISVPRRQSSRAQEE
jgi:two-component system NtrC family sensor kinase